MKYIETYSKLYIFHEIHRNIENFIYFMKYIETYSKLYVFHEILYFKEMYIKT